ncbi:MAG: nuclear transport factor 2 family protein [Verrucomicrobiae bacterium]|nr:nuclear transport factor 2 family protein [Verrucomicrobiae bacterium]
MPNNRERIKTLLKGIETGDPAAVTFVNESKYIQHNPLTREGNIGLAELFKRLAKTSPKVEIVRIFEDGDFVFAHTDYDFNVVEVGFEVFRFEDGKAVEHWDNLQSKAPSPNPSGHLMIDGPTDITDLDRTELNREFVRLFVDDILINRRFGKLEQYVDPVEYTEHNPHMADGLPALRKELAGSATDRSYQTIHRVLAEGNFVLSVCEGSRDGNHASFYDLFRLASGRIVEHWDTTEEVPPRELWKNENGKF